ncbi:helix-turn-helix transcriptional regulator [Tenggerimyces flavus]|uniref:Helix-turn-helix transcriptional regulator n=1 Tax=Tenggerimyces flavus TaxID=1708749 RepID=A0ABV7YK23_9ACTN|nr:YafY family protein [Tenggerimyces flavus]MBM7787229.1 putative DNA-binding transcriptional regulator YafY [Tenggerimyces flavus]
MRAERLLRLLLHLQTRGQSTVVQLARLLEVSPRTVQRDLDALSLAGVPVYSVRGRGGGWALLPDYRTRLTGLTPAEVMSVFVGATAHVLADLGIDASSDQAMAKLIATLPEPARRDAEFARQRLLIDHAGWDDHREAPRWLNHCRQAIWAERRLSITYRDPAEPFTVAPLGLVAKARTWYLVATRPDGAVRTYRLSRVTSASLTDEAFTRPRDFDLARHWDEAQRLFQASLPSYRIVLRVRGHAVRRFKAIGPVVSDVDGWSVVEADLENADEACAAVLAQAGDAVVVAPPELSTMVRQAASRIAESHS